MSLKAVISANASGFFAEMKKVEASSNKLKHRFGAMAAAGGAVGAGIAAGFMAVTTTIKAVEAGIKGVVNALKSSSMEAAGIESLTMQFETLLGGADNAKKRMQEITKFAASTPFEIKELAATSKLLQTLGGDMLATGKGLRMVGDAAAISGQPIAEVGLNIGRIFNAITSGTSAGESVNRLQELGLMTGKAKIGFEQLAAAQKKGTADVMSQAQAMELLGNLLGSTSGAMERLATTTEGKLSNLRDNFDQLKVALGTGINEGLKDALNAVNDFLPKLQASMTKAGEIIGAAIKAGLQGDTETLSQIAFAIGKIIGDSAKLGYQAAIDKAKGRAKYLLGAGGPGRVADIILQTPNKVNQALGLPDSKHFLGANESKFGQTRNEFLKSEEGKQGQLVTKLVENFQEQMKRINEAMLKRQQAELISELKNAGINSPLTVSGTNNDKLETMIQELRRITQLLQPVAN
jgi:hypothetical protein